MTKYVNSVSEILEHIHARGETFVVTFPDNQERGLDVVVLDDNNSYAVQISIEEMNYPWQIVDGDYLLEYQQVAKDLFAQVDEMRKENSQ